MGNRALACGGKGRGTARLWHSIGVWVVDGRAEGNGTGLWALRKDRAWGTGMGSGPVALGKGESWGTGIGMARASNDIRAMENSHQCSAEDFGRAHRTWVTEWDMAELVAARQTATEAGTGHG